MNCFTWLLMIMAVVLVIFIIRDARAKGNLCRSSYGGEWYYSQERTGLCVNAITGEKKVLKELED